MLFFFSCLVGFGLIFVVVIVFVVILLGLLLGTFVPRIRSYSFTCNDWFSIVQKKVTIMII